MTETGIAVQSSSKRRFVIVTDTYSPDVNGVAMTLTELSRRLASRGHTLDIYYPRAQTQTQISGVTLHEIQGIPLPGYPQVRLGLPRPVAFAQEWQRERPDAIYVATEGMLGSSALRVATKLGIRVVSGYHTHFPQYLRHYHLPGLETLAVRFLRRWHNRSALTLTPSPDVAAMLSCSGFLNVAVLGRGVDCDLFSPHRRDQSLRRQWGASPETPVMLCVGRVAAEKNLELTITTYRGLKKRFPDLILVMVGDGPCQARLASMDRSVRWVGVQRGEKLASHYASADLFLFPSLTETYGNVLAEAMASGLVTVSFDYAASHQLVQHGVSGFQAPLGHAAAFTEMAERALVERSTWPEIAQRARASILPLSWESVVHTFERGLLGHAVLAQRPVSSVSPSHKDKPSHDHATATSF